MKIDPEIGFFYHFVEPERSKAMRVDLDPGDYDETALLAGVDKPSSPLRATYAMGGSSEDIVWTTLVKPIIVAERVIDALERYQLSGWSTYPVQVTDKTGNTQRTYQGLAITGRCGPEDESRTSVVLKEYPAGLFPVFKGLYFDLATWDGSDFFLTSDDSSWLLVSERVKNTFALEKIRNVEFVSLDDVERMTL